MQEENTAPESTPQTTLPQLPPPVPKFGRDIEGFVLSGSGMNEEVRNHRPSTMEFPSQCSILTINLVRRGIAGIHSPRLRAMGTITTTGTFLFLPSLRHDRIR